MSTFKNSPNAENAEAGYCKPPKESRFKKGQSGNPAGRPKSKGNLLSFQIAEMDREVNTTSGQQISQREAYVRALIEHATLGNSPSFRKFIELGRRAHMFDKLPDGSPPTSGVIHIDRNRGFELANMERLRKELRELEARIASGELKEVRK